MKKILRFPVICCVLVAFSGSVDATDRPNILVIFTDDHGWADLGANGVDDDIRTPHTDQLAAHGVRFTRGYVTAPQCTPSRAGLITGIYQQRFGVEHNGLPMRKEVLTLPERLKAAGYVSGISGKWHLEVSTNPDATSRRDRFVKHRELLPHAQGFDEYFVGVMQDYVASHALDGTPFPDAPRDITEEGCRVVLQTEAALGFLKRRASNPKDPWFLYVSYMAPHTPLEYPEPWFSQTPEHLPMQRRSALALIAAIDDGVGRIRRQLRAMGQEENTLIFFLGDNGAPLAPSDPNARRNPWDGSINLPMRGQKGMLSEGGIRVPFVAAWPGTIPGGQVFEHPVISLDIATTAVAAAGLLVPQELDGVDLLPHLTGAKAGPPHETLYWRWVDQAAIQEYPYKLVLAGGHKPVLFDIITPEGEHRDRDLADENPAVAIQLRKKLDTWMATLQPPGPPEPLAPHRLGNFLRDEILPEPKVAGARGKTVPAAPEGSIRGWICRNGKIAIRDGSLVVERDEKAESGKRARTFLSHARLDLAGPIKATLRLRSMKGGPSTLTWRTRTAQFTPDQVAAFDWPAGAEFKDVTLELSEKGRIIHIRVTPALAAESIEVQSIILTGANGEVQKWDFNSSE
jgi:arylsulfatase A-like enzyme